MTQEELDAKIADLIIVQENRKAQGIHIGGNNGKNDVIGICAQWEKLVNWVM